MDALPLGNAAYNVPTPVGSLALAKLFFGEGSMLERMVNSFLQGNTTQQMWCLPIPRPAAGIKASGSISIATQQSGSGILTVYIAGQKVQVTVYQTDTQATVAANLAAAINAMTTLPVMAAVDGTVTSKVDLTCRWHGLTGNDITIIPNYRGAYGGEALPVGMTLTSSAHGRRRRHAGLHGGHLGDPVAPVLPLRHALQRHGFVADLGRRGRLRPDRPLGLHAGSSTAGSTTSAATPTRACSSGG